MSVSSINSSDFGDNKSLKKGSPGSAADGKMEGEVRGSKGLSFQMAGFFIVAQLAGAGFLSLPSALANTGWLGVPMMVLFCVMVGFAATRLGHCWVLLEEIWPEEYNKPARQPYMEMAFRAYGRIGRGIALFSVVATQFGTTTVFIILIGETLTDLTNALSTCYWVIIMGTIIIPFTWLGSPKDFWQGPALAVVSTIFACVIIFIQTLLDADDAEYVQFYNPSVNSFALGFGTILFAFGGASVFPTIQNDMKDRTEFWKSITVGFICILTLYLPTSVAGYAVFGSSVDSNILFAVTPTVAVKCAMALQVINLLGSYLIGFSTVSQAFEESFNVPTNFTWKRVVMRTAIVCSEMIIGLAIPNFSLVLNLIGGSTVTVCTFILPPLMYLTLSKAGPLHTQREIPLWMKVALIEIVIIGTIGGILSTVSAFIAIITTPLSQSCFAGFSSQ